MTELDENRLRSFNSDQLRLLSLCIEGIFLVDQKKLKEELHKFDNPPPLTDDEDEEDCVGRGLNIEILGSRIGADLKLNGEYIGDWENY